MAVTACLSFESELPAWDAAGAAAWQRFTEITQLAGARPISLNIGLSNHTTPPLQLDLDGQALTRRHELWSARTRHLSGALLSAHPDWLGTPAQLRITEQLDYAGSRCDGRVTAMFPLDSIARLCPAATEKRCVISCDSIACERR